MTNTTLNVTLGTLNITSNITSHTITITWDTLISVIAVLLSCLGIYYIHKSVRSPILLEARKKHTEELREFLRGWYDNFPIYERATEPKTTPTPSAPISYMYEHWHNSPNIEKNWKYQDIIQFHLPNKYKTLPMKWDKYKKTDSRYGEIRYQLYEKIKKDVLSEINLKYDVWGEDHTISKHFIELLYTQYVTWIRDGRLSADKTRGYKREGDELWFSGGQGLAKGTEEELSQVKGVFENMMFDEKYLIKYETDVSKIIDMEKELENMCKEIKEMIEKLMGRPLLPGTKCEMLKNV